MIFEYKNPVWISKVSILNIKKFLITMNFAIIYEYGIMRFFNGILEQIVDVRNL